MAERVAAARRAAERVGAGCDDAAVRTAIVSDLHLGLSSGADLLRRESFRARLLEAIEGVDRLVLLGDVLELRDRPLREALDAAAPAFADLAAALGDAELVIVPGNHDHHLIEPWLDRRALDGADRPRPRADGRAGRAGVRSAGRARRSDRTALRLPRHLAARGRLRHPRPLPRPPPHRADARAARGRCDRAGARDPLPRPGSAGAAGRARPAPRRRVRARPDPGLRAPLRPRPGDGRRAPRRRRPLGAALEDDRRRRVAGRADARLAARLGRGPRRGRARQPARARTGRARTSRPGRSGVPGSRRWARWSTTSGSTRRT